MTRYLELADTRILLWLNHLLARSPAAYKVALFLTDTGADLALGVTAAWLWFWPEAPGAREGEGPAPAARRRLSRRESRARLLVFGCVAMGAYVMARLTAIYVDRDRPFVTYLPVHGVPGSFEGLRTFGTFPSDHAALLGALPIAFARWSPALGWAWGALAVVFVIARIAVGFHYPSDMLAGGALGALAAVAAMGLYDRSARVRTLAGVVAAGFSRRPWAYALYALLALGAAEFAMHFKHVLALIMAMRARVG